MLQHLAQRSPTVGGDGEPHDLRHLVPVSLPETWVTQDLYDREVLLKEGMNVARSRQPLYSTGLNVP